MNAKDFQKPQKLRTRNPPVASAECPGAARYGHPVRPLHLVRVNDYLFRPLVSADS